MPVSWRLERKLILVGWILLWLADPCLISSEPTTDSPTPVLQDPTSSPPPVQDVEPSSTNGSSSQTSHVYATSTNQIIPSSSQSETLLPSSNHEPGEAGQSQSNPAAATEIYPSMTTSVTFIDTSGTVTSSVEPFRTLSDFEALQPSPSIPSIPASDLSYETLYSSFSSDSPFLSADSLNTHQVTPTLVNFAEISTQPPGHLFESLETIPHHSTETASFYNATHSEQPSVSYFSSMTSTPLPPILSSEPTPSLPPTIASTLTLTSVVVMTSSLVDIFPTEVFETSTIFSSPTVGPTSDYPYSSPTMPASYDNTISINVTLDCCDNVTHLVTVTQDDSIDNSTAEVPLVKDSGLSAPAIVGIFLGCLVFVVLLGILLFILFYKRKSKSLDAIKPNHHKHYTGLFDDSIVLSYINNQFDIQKDPQDEMISLDNDAYLNSLELTMYANNWGQNKPNTKF